MNRPISDPFLLYAQTKPKEDQVDIVEQLEKDLRSNTKNEQATQQSQVLGSSGLELPDIDGQNEYLKQKAAKYAQFDNVPPRSSSVLGDFSRLLEQTATPAYQNNSVPRNQLMAMSYSTLQNEPGTRGESERITESQLNYQLAASDFGLVSLEKKAVKEAKKNNRLVNNRFIY